MPAFAHASWSTPTIPVRPSYVGGSSPSRSTSASSEANAVTPTGRECGTSASSAPSVTTICTPSASASSTTVAQNVRQRYAGSGPVRITRSRGARGTRASCTSMSGHSIRRWWLPDSRTVGRVDWKSTNSSGSITAKRSAPSPAPRKVSAEEADSPASFQPLNAQISAGARSPSGRRSQRSGCIADHGSGRAAALTSGARSIIGVVSVAELSALRAGDEVAGVYACTRKHRLIARTGAPYLALELRDRTTALPARVFRDADLLGGRFDRGDLVAVEGRVERFRDELQVDVRAIERARDADPAAFLPVAYRDLHELDGFLEHLSREVLEPGL